MRKNTKIFDAMSGALDTMTRRVAQQDEALTSLCAENRELRVRVKFLDELSALQERQIGGQAANVKRLEADLAAAWDVINTGGKRADIGNGR